MRAIEKLKRWLDESGTRQAALAAEVGISQMRLSRVLSGKGSLPPAKLTDLERATGIEGLALSLAAELPKGRNRASKTPPPEVPDEVAPADPTAALRALVGELPEGSDVVATFGERFGLPVLGGLWRLATTARSEGVRLRALESLADRCFGRPMQRVRDETPRAPIESPELVEAFAAVIKKAKGSP